MPRGAGLGTAIAASGAMDRQSPTEVLRRHARPLRGEARDHDALLALLRDARYVLLGEASHGTHEFYAERAAITRRLIEELGFDALAIEADWPDSYRLNRFVRGADDDGSGAAALAGFHRFPTWMWRNADMVAFLEWLRAHNLQREEDRRTGIYGLDLYSLRGSMAAVTDYLSRTDPAAADRARQRYACFDHFDGDTRRYSLLAGLDVSGSCRQQVLAMLVDMRRHAARRAHDLYDVEAAFDAVQNARLVNNAEAYYRSTVFRNDGSSWNLRDRHMAETLSEIERHIGRDGRAPKIVVWAHNSHLGDARATEMGQRRGELSLGQLVRQQHGNDCALIGFTTHAGQVLAAGDWDGAHERKTVLASRPDSYERLFHATGVPRFMLPLRQPSPAQQLLMAPRRERAIGVIYRPDTELTSHYFHACLPMQFDAVIHIDQTSAVLPLDEIELPALREAAETYPSGL
jgi:erythromycin esterase-like protein